MKSLLLPLLMVCALVPAFSSANVLHSIGIARDSSDSTLRYVEHHQYLPSGEHLVTYFDVNGEIIATKAMRYPGLPQHPEISQSDLTRNIDVRTRVINQTLEMIRYDSDRVRTHEIPLDETIIVDAGFDSFVRNNWHGFVENVPQAYKFAVAGQGRLLKVNITKQAVSPGETAFVIKPSNPFIRMLMPDIHLRYNQDRRLIAYEGLTNLYLPDGQSRHVSVEFVHYKGPGELARPLARWIPDR
jgi:hypothetical protein